MTNVRRGQEASRSLRASSAALPSLTLCAVSFFLPFVRVCGRMETPLHFVATGTPLAAAWIAPRFLVAGLLAVLAALALGRRRVPGARSTAVAFVGLATLALSMVLEWRLLGEALAHGEVPWPWLGWLSLASALAVVGTASALRHRGWDRFIRVIGVYVALASPTCVLVLDALDSGARLDVSAVALGGYGFTIALLVLLALVVIALWPAAVPTETRPPDPPPGPDGAPPPPDGDPPPDGQLPLA